MKNPIWTAILVVAAVNAQDRRNTEIPDTDTHFTMPAYGSLAEWESRKQVLRNQILFAAGLLPMPDKTPLHPHVFGRLERDGYTIEKVYLETLPGYYLGGNLYRPARATGKAPGLLIAHGHWDYGRLENQQLNSTPTQGATMARQGYVVFAYDMVGYNDTVQTPHEFGGPREQLWAFTPLGLQLWNSIRALDFVAGLDGVDRERLGITGASGGGTQTFLLTAVDDRVHFAAPVNMVSAIMQGGCICENAPGLRIGTFNVEIAAMAAPRPMILISGPQDWTENVHKEEYPAIRRIYELYGKPDNVANTVVDAHHNYNRESREAVYRFFGKHVLGAADSPLYKEKEIHIEKLQDMLAFWGRPRPDGAATYDALFASWRDNAARLAARDSDPAAIRERLALALHAALPEKVESRPEGDRVVLSRPGQGDRVPALWMPGQGMPALVVDPGGISAARESAMVRQLRGQNRPVLMIDAFQTGTCVAPRNRKAKQFLTFNPSDDAARVQDILTAVAYLQSQGQKSIELVGNGKASTWALFAAALAPAVATFAPPQPGTLPRTDEQFIADFFVPGIRKAGGVDAALRIVRKPQ